MMNNQTCHAAGLGSLGLKKTPLPLLVPLSVEVYRPRVAAKSVTGRRNPSKQKAHSALDSISGVFLRLRFRFMAAVRGQTSVWPGFLLPRYSYPTHSCHLSRRKDRGSSSIAEGATPMLTHFFPLTPEQIQTKIEVHRARAFAQLRNKSSLKVRTERYNEQMARARFYEALLAGGAE